MECVEENSYDVINKDIVINNILSSVATFIPEEISDQIRDAITVELYKYKIEEQCTELVLNSEETNIKILRKFLGIKKLENKSDKTIQRYYQQIVKMLDFFSEKDIREITADDIRYYLAYKRIHGNCSGSVDGIRRILSSFYSYLSDEDIIEKNPMRKIKKAKVDKVIREPFTDEEIQEIEKACTNHRDAALVELLFSTGCRVSEICGINIKDIDFKEQTILVTGKGNKQRYVYYSDKCAELLEKYLNNRKWEYEKHYTSEALFVSRSSDRLSKNGVEEIIHKLGDKINVHSFPHKFRHTLASKLSSLDMDILDISNILGHSSINTTSIYIHKSDKLRKQKYEELMN